MTMDIWCTMPEFLKKKVVNSVDQKISLPIGISLSGWIRPLHDKPAIRQLANGRWVNTNTCKYWSNVFEWEAAIHWCDLQNQGIN